MTMARLILCVVCSLAIALGQIWLKLAAQSLKQENGQSFLHSALTSPPLYAAFAWYGLSSLLWFYILTKLPLNKAYPFVLLGAACVPLLSTLILKEPLGGRYAAGFALVLGGLWIMSTSRYPA